MLNALYEEFEPVDLPLLLVPILSDLFEALLLVL